MKQIVIDFLYLDLNTCERCMATDETLKKALGVLSGVFDTLGYQVNGNSVNIISKRACGRIPIFKLSDHPCKRCRYLQRSN